VKVLLDTCVVSEIQKPDGNQRVKDAVLRLAPDDVFLSAITVGEVRYGISLLPDGRKRTALEHWFMRLQEEYSDRILPVTVDIARDWGELTAQVRRSGGMLFPADGLIAASALRHGMRVLTRNTRDFAASGVPLIDPWDEAEGLAAQDGP